MSIKKTNDSGCFSTLLRRILCTGSPQTHPSDRFSGPDEAKFVDEVKIQVQSPDCATTFAPGVVARLMGLDSLPEKNWASERKSPGPVTRSRSVNFMDYLLEFDLKETKNRRVGKSVSFREEVRTRPAFPQDPGHEFLLVYLKDRNVSKKKEKEAKQRKSEKQKEENQRKIKNKRIIKFQNEPRRLAGKNSSGNRRKGDKDDRIERGMNSKPKISSKSIHQTRKKRNQIGVGKTKSLSEVPNSMEMELSSNKPCYSIVEEVKGNCDMIESEFSPELAGMLYNLAKEDLEQCKWTNVKGFEDFEELCVDFGEHLLNYMLCQVVDELVE